MASRKRSSGPRRIEVPVGPFVGMRDQPDQTASDRLYASYLLNVYTQQAEIGTAQVARPALVQMSASQLGSGGARTAQALYQHTMQDGTRYNLLFTGGKVYRVTFSAVTAATATVTDVTPVGPTISTTSRIYCCSLGDSLIVSDGVNKPWVASSLSATPIIGTHITAASGAWYGPPVVYYAKLFGILVSERTTLEWSEENDPTTGYAANNFNNQWTLGQTSGSALTCLFATNSALYYFRENGIGTIGGAVSDDFATTGVHDSVSTTVGTGSPASVFGADGSIFFLDMEGRPRELVPGGGVRDWPNDAIRVATTQFIAANRSLCVGCYLPDVELAALTYVGGDSLPKELLMFDPKRQTCQGYWRQGDTSPYRQFRAVGILTDTNGSRYFSYIDQDGYWYVMERERLSTSSLDRDSSGTPITTEAQVISPPLAPDPAAEMQLTRLDLNVRTGASDALPAVPLKVAYQVPRADYGTALAPVVPMTAVQYDNAHVAVGINARGRYVRFKFFVSHATTSAPRFAFVQAVATGAIVGTPVGVK
jgi:hypothetical protein